jgi:protein involved in polysaccharide export with SLBB domain
MTLRKIILPSILLISVFTFAQAIPQGLDEDFLNSLPDEVADDVLKEFERSTQAENQIYDRTSTELEKSKTLQKWQKFLREEELNENKLLKRFGSEIFQSMQSTFMPVNEPNIDDSYILDYGDFLNIQLVGKISAELSLEVQRDGSITIPDYGKIRVAGLSLVAASEMIVENVSNSLLGTRAFVSLEKIRDIQVLVSGYAYFPGMYTVSGNTNILHILNIVGGITDEGTYRDIAIKRQGKLIQNIDLYDYLIDGSIPNEKRIKSGDTIYIGPLNKLVRASGGFKTPALYELKENENLDHLMRFAKGISNNGAQDKIFFTEIISGKTVNKEISINNFSKIIPSHESHLYVEEYLINVVEISGEIKRPGIYSISEYETLSSLVKRAGGYKENSYTYGSQLYRKSIADLQEVNNDKIYDDLIKYIATAARSGAQQQNLQQSNLPFILNEFKKTKPLGRIQIEFDTDKISLNPSLDTILQDQDKIVISNFDNQIHVFGEVMNSGSFRFNSNLGIEDYIFSGGGLSDFADKNSIVLVLPDGTAKVYQKSFLKYSNLDIYPGTVIYIPRKIGKLDGLNFASTAAPIFSALALSIASVASISNN